jgi:hypothetical protein
MFRHYCVILREFVFGTLLSCGPGSSVGIATELRAGRSGDRIPVRARFSAPVQIVPGAQPASYTMGTGSFPGVKYGRGVTLTPHPFLEPRSWKSRAIPLLPLWTFVACSRFNFTFIRVRTVTYLKYYKTQSLQLCGPAIQWVYQFSISLGATLKFWALQWWRDALSMLRSHKY